MRFFKVISLLYGINFRLGYIFPHHLHFEIYQETCLDFILHFFSNKLAILLSFTVIYRRRHIQLLKQQAKS